MELLVVEEKVPKFELDGKGFLECKCNELEERCRKAEARCLELELEVGKVKNENEALQTILRALEMEKLSIEDELRGLKMENESKVGCGGEKVRKGVVDLTQGGEDESRVLQLMIENNVLECEKQKAESDVEVWKQKCKELESLALQLKKGLILTDDGHHAESSLNHLDKVVNLEEEGGSLQEAATPYNDTPDKQFTSIKKQNLDVCLDRQLECVNRIRRHLVFEECRQPIKKMAPSTAGTRPASPNVIDIHDSDEEHDLTNVQMSCSNNYGNRNLKFSTNLALEENQVSKKNLQANGDHGNGENVDSCEDNGPVISTPKRKRPSNVVTSDSESDVNDKIPISKVMKMRRLEMLSDQASSELKDCPVIATPSGVDNVRGTVNHKRRQLVSLRQYEENARKDKCSSIEDVEHEDSKEVGSDNDSDSLSGFIVNDSHSTNDDNTSDGSDLDDASSGSRTHSESQNCSDGVDFDELLSSIKRKKNGQMEWKFEGDMLAAFGKDDTLCMKAVCALYRQQTREEQVCRGTLAHNRRGFSQCDAFRGSTLAEFLTEGNPHGDVKKSVKELKEYDPKGVAACHKLATHYSKQLFEIYKNKEDPYFLPS
ncbi:hypothetical protein SLEP1_g3342 [Rubroshorea leprosula]|uniref:Uncharacterized protein n=1 Tax=Rubroshorea leprosula TaxID=152421 RepID=A0AAV5HVX6_9ROSI|nr:hypothetical protein SLEP1_g3342 [Rubroshorea leprosula]